MNASKAQVIAAVKSLMSAPMVREKDDYPEVRKIDGKYSIEAAKYCRFNGQMLWVVALENGMYRTAPTRAQLERSIAARNAEVEAAVAKNNADIEFRMEVVEEMVAAGIAKHVALNRTANQKGLMDCAREYGVI